MQQKSQHQVRNSNSWCWFRQWHMMLKFWPHPRYIGWGCFFRIFLLSAYPRGVFFSSPRKVCFQVEELRLRSVLYLTDFRLKDNRHDLLQYCETEAKTIHIRYSSLHQCQIMKVVIDIVHNLIFCVERKRVLKSE